MGPLFTHEIDALDGSSKTFPSFSNAGLSKSDKNKATPLTFGSVKAVTFSLSFKNRPVVSTSPISRTFALQMVGAKLVSAIERETEATPSAFCSLMLLLFCLNLTAESEVKDSISTRQQENSNRMVKTCEDTYPLHGAYPQSTSEAYVSIPVSTLEEKQLASAVLCCVLLLSAAAGRCAYTSEYLGLPLLLGCSELLCCCSLLLGDGAYWNTADHLPLSYAAELSALLAVSVTCWEHNPGSFETPMMRSFPFSN